MYVFPNSWKLWDRCRGGLGQLSGGFRRVSEGSEGSGVQQENSYMATISDALVYCQGFLVSRCCVHFVAEKSPGTKIDMSH